MNHKWGIFRTIAWLCLCGLMLGFAFSCGTFGGSVKQDKEGLQQSVEAFNTAIRWEDFKAASAFLPVTARERFWNLTDQLHAQTRVVEFEIREVMLDRASLSNGTIFIRFRFYGTSDPHMQNKTIQQKWHYEEKLKAWHVIDHNLTSLLMKK